jgi:biopolymer transport protein ExbD
MAHADSAEDNPVGINVVPMVDIIFCLCVFFMCSFKFKELEGRFDAWLPKDLGNGPMATAPIEEIRVALTWDAARRTTVRQFGRRMVTDDEELAALLSGAHADCVHMGKSDTPVTVDGDERVPWNQVVGVIDTAKRVGIARFELARGPDAH